MSKRNSWYEDDCVEYTSDGRNPKIPKKYSFCYYRFGQEWHKLKSFRTKAIAEISFKYATQFNKDAFEKYIVFKCENCQQYHIMLKRNYDDCFEPTGKYYGKTYISPIFKNKAK